MPEDLLDKVARDGFRRPGKPDLLFMLGGKEGFYLFSGNSLMELYYLDRDVPEMGIYKDLDDDVSVRERLERILDARFESMKNAFSGEYSKMKHVKRMSILNTETGESEYYENKEMIAEDKLNRAKVQIVNSIFRNPN